MTEPAPAYPARQPFPARTAQRIGQDQDQSLFQQTSVVVTYATPPFVPARKALDSYLEQYRSDTIRDGTTLGIYGAYGSGKTHLVRDLVQRCADASSSAQRVYAKVESSDFLALYKEILRQIDHKTLTAVNARLVSRLAQREAGKSETTQALLAPLEEKPERVFEYLNRALLADSDIRKPQSEWVRKITKAEDFLHAVSWLPDPTLGQSAAAWFRGEALPDLTLRRMGITSPINDRTGAMAGLAFLISVYGEVRQPFLLFIDQAERLLPAHDPTVKTENAASIQALAEWAQEKLAFLCVAGATSASGATADLPGRFTVMVGMPRLDASSTANLLKAYISTGSTFTPCEDESEIAPFKMAAVQEMVRLVHGSIRGILRLAYQSFELAFPERRLVDADTVLQAFRQFDDYFNEQSILAKIKELLAEAGLSFSEEISFIGGQRVDLAVQDGRDIFAYIEVKNPIFDTDEALSALDVTKLSLAIRSASPEAKFILVAAGYLSPQVRERLSTVGPDRTVDHYLVYAPDSFEDDFRLVMRTLTQERRRRAQEAPAPPPPPSVDVLKPINDLKAYFEKVLDERLGSTQLREQRIQGAASVQRAVDQVKSSALAQAHQREFQAVEQKRVEQARKDKESRETQERDRLRLQGEIERKRRALQRACWVAPLCFLVLLAAIAIPQSLKNGFVVHDYPPRQENSSTTIYWLPLLFGGLAGTVSYAYSMSLFGPGAYNRLVRATNSTFPKLRDLDDQAIFIGRTLSSKSPALITALADPNPQVRYASARILDLGKGSFRADIMWFVRKESWVKVETILLRIAERDRESSLPAFREELTEHLSYATDPEALYVIDAIARASARLNEDFKRPELKGRPVHLMIHGILSGVLPGEIDPGTALSGRDRFLLEFTKTIVALRDPYLRWQLEKTESSHALRLALLFTDSIPDRAPDLAAVLERRDMEALSPQRIEEAMALFGPGGPESLGDYDDLDHAPLHQSIYDFFCRIRLALFEFESAA